MSLTRTIYGIEYDENAEDGRPSGMGWVVIALLVAAAAVFAFAMFRRMSSQAAGDGGGAAPSVAASPVPPVSPHPTGGAAPSAAIDVPDISSRPPKVRSLVMRLNEAARNGDLEMQISTIEQIRALPPGDSAPDIVSRLTPVLGELNLHWLFERRNPQWVAEVAVRRGDNASRIAREHGSTFRSMARLNRFPPGAPLAAGSKVYVMNHPRFSAVANKRMRCVDLYLKGKFFKRYLLGDDAPAISAAPGNYKSEAVFSSTLKTLGISLPAADARELDVLVPAGAPVIVAES